MKKIFCLGFNKTGTTSLHESFKRAGIKSCHRAIWSYWSKKKKRYKFSKFDAYSDGCQSDFIWLKQNFPDAIFILNTRNLKNWLVSRYNHVERNKKRNNANWVNNSESEIRRWVIERTKYHKRILDFFGNDISIIDVEKSCDIETSQILSRLINTRIKIERAFVSKNKKDYIKNILAINKVLKELKIAETDYDKLYIPHLLK